MFEIDPKIKGRVLKKLFKIIPFSNTNRRKLKFTIEVSYFLNIYINSLQNGRRLAGNRFLLGAWLLSHGVSCRAGEVASFCEVFAQGGDRV